ncbi:MmpS family transport accessory protein [Micromonospora sp. NBC_01796]|uniref:MmpS family transport accessory protein n=1 Tax=Micromonospora sp. NBC_01796 TaxID=2975987 RepID=UPI002DD8D132|nr:MmpS family transport accessory protein [Micromonospora sp. NBC_01796]WSA84849.1 MmpS family transport accessory protein [Micromonospora sp. NBC_01796]
MTDHVDITGVRRPWFRSPKVIGAVAAVVVIGVSAWVGIAVFGGDREIRMEVTSNSGEVAGINWRGPDDGNKIHQVGGPLDTVETPWNESIEVNSATGVVVLNGLAEPGSTATCRLLVGDKVVHEKTGTPFANCMVTAQRAFPAS